ncbi:PH domain-containing protein (plasmid) [Brevibacillus halotolerans]|nr:PH domain-containing protein [Brevibacillus halotolerans]
MIIPIAFFIFKELRSDTGSQPYWVYVVATFISIIICIWTYLSWRNNTYSVDVNELEIKKGVFTSTQRVIPLNKINTINIHQSWLYRLLAVVKVEIQTSDSDQRADAKITVSNRKAKKLEHLLSFGTISNTDESNQSPEYKKIVTNKDLLMMSISSTNFWIGIPFAFTIIKYVVNWFAPTTKKEMTIREMSDDKVWSGIDIVSLIVVGSILVALCIVLSWMISMIMVQIKYKNWTITRKNKHIFIHFGMFEKKKVQIHTDKIQSIRLKEHWLNRLFGYGSVWIDCVSYEGENKVKILIPALKMAEIEEVLDQVLPEFVMCKDLKSLPKRSNHYYISVPILCSLVLIGGISLSIYLPFLYALPLLFVIYIYRLLIYKQTKWAIHQNQLVLSKPGLTKTTVYVLRRAVESVIVTQNAIQRFWKIKQVKIDINSPSRRREYVLIGINDDHINQILNWYKNDKIIQTMNNRNSCVNG